MGKDAERMQKKPREFKQNVPMPLRKGILLCYNIL